MNTKQFLFVIIFILASVFTVYSENRVALVIGNGIYSSSPLKNSVNDAKDMASTLKSLNFEVILLTDSNKREMLSGIKDFGNKLTSESIGLFYYAGHGTQIENINYLIPIDANIETASDVEFEAVALNRLIRSMEDSNVNKSLIFLDACRDNPYASSSRSGTRGLTVVSAKSSENSAGSLIAFATSPGSVAADGDGSNGIFTSALLKYIIKPGLEINQIMTKVRADVMGNTNGKQQPWTNVSLTEEFYFSPTSNSVVSQETNIEESNKETISADQVIIPTTKTKKWSLDTGILYMYSASDETGYFSYPGINIGASYQISEIISLGLSCILIYGTTTYPDSYVGEDTPANRESQTSVIPSGYANISIGNKSDGLAIDIVLGQPIGIGVYFKNFFAHYLYIIGGGAGLHLGYSF